MTSSSISVCGNANATAKRLSRDTSSSCTGCTVYWAFRAFLQKMHQVTLTVQMVYDQVVTHVRSPLLPNLLRLQPQRMVAAIA